MGDLFGATTTIKAISLWQPWASLMAAGVKLHETRHWATAYRGPIAIHAAKVLDLAGAPDALCLAQFGLHWADDLPRGAVVAVGHLTGCVPAGGLHDLTRADRAAGNFTPGRFAWRIERLRPLPEPIPLAGRQGLFNWEPPGDLEDRLAHMLDHQRACERIRWAA